MSSHGAETGVIRLPVRAVLSSSDLYREGTLLLEGSRIAGWDRAAKGAPPWFALPGLRNAHAHLGLSDLEGVARPRTGFSEWLSSLLEARGPLDSDREWRAARRGAKQALESGTTSVGDIDTTGGAVAGWAEGGLRGISFLEGFGTFEGKESRAAEHIRRMQAWIGLRPGLSPHAPYSAASSLYRGFTEVARRHGLWLTTHASESRDELEYLATARGPLAEFLSSLGAPPAFTKPPGTSPLAYLDTLGVLGPNVLLAHVNYLVENDLERIRRSGASVVYCPRSHAFFGHPPHPVQDLIASGVRVALGTDSLASNDSLSMFDEMAFLRVARPDVDSGTVFRMATTEGAAILDGGGGCLDTGESADVVLVETLGTFPRRREEALDVVTKGGVKVVATLVRGQICFASAEAGEGSLPLTPGGRGLWFSDRIET